jgi:RNA-directed DNA polymerase
MRPPPMARLVASALLGGEWEPHAMAARVAHMLGHPRVEGRHRAIARVARDAFLRAPRHARDALADVLVRHPVWRRFPQARLRALVVDEPAMGPSHVRVPEATTVGALADLLGTTPDTLDALADRRGLARVAREEHLRHHHVRCIPKRDGTSRVLEIPKPRLRELQRRVLDRILVDVPAHPAAHGFVRRMSALDHALSHVGKAVVIRADLRDFFSHVTAARVGGVFRAMGYPDEVRRTLTALTTVATPEAHLVGLPWGRRVVLRVPHLAQGAPTSPSLANLVAYGLDVRLSALARSLGGVYGRYADDLVLSGGRDLDRARDLALRAMLDIVRDEGFEPNVAKSSVRRRGDRQVVCGLVVNTQAAVPRAERERLEAILTNCVTKGPTSQNRDGHPDFRAHLEGRVSWVRAACPRHAEKLQRLLEAIVW